jgi:hypothetical protein
MLHVRVSEVLRDCMLSSPVLRRTCVDLALCPHDVHPGSAPHHSLQLMLTQSCQRKRTNRCVYLQTVYVEGSFKWGVTDLHGW